MTTHLCGAGMAFLGFSLSLIIGLWVNNPFTTVVSRSLVVLFFSYILGLILAGIGQKVIVENFEVERESLTAHAEQAALQMEEDGSTERQDNSAAPSTPPTAEAVLAGDVSAA